MRKVQLFSTGSPIARISLLFFALLMTGITAFAQVTSSTISGRVTDQQGEGLTGATVVAIHVPSGSRYGTSTNAVGRFTLPAVRVGGPFTVTVSYTGFEAQTIEGINTSLGTTANVDFQLAETGVKLGETEIVATRNDLFSSQRTGAASTFNQARVTSVPAIGSRSISSVTKYNPNGNGRSFGGQDTRLNNFTIDGSVFNNGFGLGSDAQAGGRTGSTAISLDAIEELQVNVAPFDVRQTGFVGAGINAVTRSGTNEFTGSVYYNTRSANMYGNKARETSVSSTVFNENVVGARIGGPILKNKAFFFVNAEAVQNSSPATTWVAAGSSNIGQVTRVAKADLDEVSDILNRKFGYVTGPYEAYNNEVNSMKFLARLDFNINDQNKLTLRYTHHDSEADVNISNSASLGFGNRTTRFEAMSYQNSGYIIGDNTRSAVLELNSTFSDKISNNFSVGYDFQDENRQYKGALFPTIDILKDNATYISVGFDPFTPDNKLSYGTFHVTDNVSYYAGKHTITAGFNYERYRSENLFFPGSNAVYIYNSLDDFRAAANGDSTAVKRFQYRYSALEGGKAPLQVLNVSKYDVYGQDEIKVSKNFTVTAGVRLSLIDMGATEALQNNVIADSSFLDIDGNAKKFNTSTLPKANILFEPRLGFNYDVFGNKTTQIRGGAGIFTGRPPFVWLSNQIGNNGVLTGFIDQSNTNSVKYPLVANPSVFNPATPTLPSTFDLALSDEGYRYPQVLKFNLAVDQKLPLGFVGTVEFLYNKNLNAVFYYNANQKESTTTFAGPDTRPRFAGTSAANREIDNVSMAAVLSTTNQGSYLGTTFKLEYPEKKGFYAMAAYTYSQTKDLMSAGSIASGSWTGARSVNGNNHLDLAFADQDIPHRVIGLMTYGVDFGQKRGGAVKFTLGYEGMNYNTGFGSRYSYTYNGDMNLDGVSGNDLLFVPVKATDLRFEAQTVGTTTYTPEQQAEFFEKYIEQDSYLSGIRGQYTERNGGILPWLNRFDLAISRDFWINLKGDKRNTLQLRADIFNVGNLINSDWGVGYKFVTTSPLQARGVDTDGVPKYRVASQLLNDSTRKTTDYASTIFDVWNVQLGVRYTFN